MKTFIKKITWLSRKSKYGIPKMEFGWGNGYVVISKEHPLYGKTHDELNEFLDIHGGITFSDYAKGIIKRKGINDDDWVIGFDTCHYDDTLENWPKEKVKEETKKLKKQIKNYEII
jgi:hypothetical protein